MGRYCIKRLLSAIPLLLVISFLIFMFIHLIPGDPARMVAGMDATEQQVQVVREQLGLDKPILTQYVDYMKGLFTGDLGDSIKNGATVADTIGSRFGATITLTFSSMIWAVIIGIGIGIVSAVKRGSPIDYLVMLIAISGISVPGFWLGLMLIQWFAVGLRLVPTQGLDTLSSYILPSITMGAGIMAILARFTRSSMLESLREGLCPYSKSQRSEQLPGNYAPRFP